MVPRPSLSRALAGPVAALLLGGGAVLGPVLPARAEPQPAQPAPARSEQAPADDAPLRVTIDQLTPSTLPERGPIEITGTVTNRDSRTWSAVNLHPFLADAPITTRAELEEAAHSDPAAPVGDRLTEVIDTVDELAPGATATYRLTLRQEHLDAVTSAGVWWFGVHASGESPDVPRDSVADGRARTFLPHVPQEVRGSVKTAVVVPLRRRIRYTATGAIAHAKVWERALSGEGNLGRPLAFGAAAFGRPVTWLVDPALPDAVRRLARGNPQRSIEPTVEAEGEDGDEQTDEPSPSDGATDGPTGEPTGDDGENADPDQETAADSPVAQAAQRWLSDLGGEVRGEHVLTLPYGDLDVDAAARHQPDLYDVARARPGAQLEDWDVTSVPTVGSPSGYLSPSGFELADDDDRDPLLLVTDRMFGAGAYPDGAPGVGRYGDSTVVITSHGATEGGPGPDRRQAPVTLRQRLLSEAALELLEDGRRAPVVMVAGPGVSGIGATNFWTGLDVEWVELTTVEDAVEGRNGVGIDPATLDYPQQKQLSELPPSVFEEVEQLTEAGEVLQNLLTLNDEVADELEVEGLVAASYASRDAPTTTTEALANSREWVETRLGRVRITAPRGVTLSSSSGSFAVTLANNLHQPVTVRIEASADQLVSVDVGEEVQLGPQSRATVVLDARTRGLGVHNVTLTLTDVDGEPIGGTDRVPIRSGQVGEVIWWILGAGTGILFVAIAIRLVRRIRRGWHRDRHTEGLDAVPPADTPVGGGTAPTRTEEA